MTPSWEKPNSPFSKFAAYLGASALGGILLGTLIDLSVNKLQRRSAQPSKKSCASFTVVQLAINIVVLFVAHRRIKNFVLWLQVTLAGFIFNVLFLSSQTTLQDNVKCFSRF